MTDLRLVYDWLHCLLFFCIDVIFDMEITFKPIMSAPLFLFHLMTILFFLLYLISRCIIVLLCMKLKSATVLEIWNSEQREVTSFSF